METDQRVVARLRAAGCVWAEDEAALLTAAAGSPAELDALVTRRAAGEPIEQLLGWAEFYGLRVFVDPGVFVPRRRSEFLVTVAARMARERGAPAPPLIAPPLIVPPLIVPPVIVDLCCGTGALGLAVATELARAGEGSRAGFAGLHAADLDPAAVACARRNVEPAGGHVHAGDLFGPLPAALRGRVGVLICNAPYVPTAEIAFMPAEARDHEAAMALDGGPDGLAVLRRAAAGAGGWLAPGGVLLVETSAGQAPSMTSVLAAAGLAARIHEDDESGATVLTGVSPGR